MYEGVEQEYPYVASFTKDHAVEKLLAVLDLFTQGQGLMRVQYVTIGGE